MPEPCVLIMFIPCSPPRKDLPDSSVGKESACNAGDTGSIPGSGRSLGEGIGYPLQYSGLENPMDCTVCGVAKSRTRLSDFHFTSLGCTRSRHIGSSIFIVSCRVLSVAACKLLVAAYGIQFPDQGLNWGPLHWESGVLVTGAPLEIPPLEILTFVSLLALILHTGAHSPSLRSFKEKQFPRN